jgi:hypothetical protein
MRIKEVWILAAVLLITFVSAAPNADISLNPVSFYETNEAEFNLTVNNMFKDEVIDVVKITVPSLTITQITDFLGWQNNYSSNSITWFDGDIETNSIELFQFNAESGLVDEDTNIDIEIITNDETTDIITVTVLDDTTGPVLTNPVPEDNAFLRVNITDQLVSANATDPETGILNGTFSYWDCSTGITNATIYSVPLDCADNGCETTADFSYYEEGDEMCFEYTIYNNALEATTLGGSVGFDGTAPSVELTTPEDNTVVNGAVSFIFTATDNLASSLECDLLFEDNAEDSVSALNGEETTLNFDVSNLTEGNHDWKILCRDGVGLEGESEQRNAITGNAPEITLDIGDVERTVDYEFTATITDETGIDSAYGLFGGSSIVLSQNGDEFTGTIETDINDSIGDKILTITAEDVYGFIRTENYTFNLIPGYIIDINVEPSSAEPGDIINISGTVTLDNGSDVPEENITLHVGNTTVIVPIVNQGFEHLFNATKEGTYEINATIISSDGYEYSAETVLEVGNPSVQSFSGSSSSSSSGSDFYCGDGICTGASSVNENCNNCPEDCGECPAEEPEETEPEEEPITTETPEETPRTPAGVGGASSFFRKIATNPLSWAAFTLILGLLYIAAFKPLPRAIKRKNKINWDNYFDRNK